METENAKKTWLSLLQSKKRLEREKGLHELKIQVEEGRLGEDERQKSEDAVLELVTSLTCSWEAKHGGLMAACVLLPNSQERFSEKLKGEIPLLLEHNESRVRLAAGTCIYMYSTLKLVCLLSWYLHAILPCIAYFIRTYFGVQYSENNTVNVVNAVRPCWCERENSVNAQ